MRIVTSPALSYRPIVVAYSFKERFAEPIISGRKGGTIRPDRLRHARPGEELQLYVGMRTKRCRLVARKRCLAIDPIVLAFDTREVFRANERIWGADLERFAVFDGFNSFAEMAEFWATLHGVTLWGGWHITWLAW